MSRKIELCPSLRIAKEGQMPELACYRGFTPLKVGEKIMADPDCSEVSKGFANYNCERTALQLNIDPKIKSQFDGTKKSS